MTTKKDGDPVGWLKVHKYEDGKTLYSFTSDKKHVADWAASGVVLQPVYLAPQEPAVNVELLEIAGRLALATNEGDDASQGTHYVDASGRIRCKGSFLALIEDARAALAKQGATA